MPYAVAVKLIKAGMHFTYAQLLAAVDSMVAGVEVWVQAQKQLGIKTDIPAKAVAVCCDGAEASVGFAMPGSQVISLIDDPQQYCEACIDALLRRHTYRKRFVQQNICILADSTA